MTLIALNFVFNQVNPVIDFIIQGSWDSNALKVRVHLNRVIRIKILEIRGGGGVINRIDWAKTKLLKTVSEV